MLALAVELGNKNLVQLLLEAAATVTSEESLVPPLMTAVLHRHRDNVQLLLHARADPWQAVPICALCDHPWYWFGLLSRRECVNAVQVSAAQDPVDTVADLLTQSGNPMDHVRVEWHQNPQPCLTAMSERATLIAQYRATPYARWPRFSPLATTTGRPLSAGTD